MHIFVSGDLDENRIDSLLHNGGRADSFGVGTALSTSADAPYIGVIYKLVEVEYQDHVRRTAKFSAEKKTYPGRKQVFRISGADGKFVEDIIGLEGESFPAARPLMVKVMRSGRRVEAKQSPAATAHAARKQFLADRECLPARFAALAPAEPPYAVHYSERLEELCRQVQQTTTARKPLVARNKSAVLPGIVFWEVDTQADFMFPGGKLYVPGAEKIIPNLNRLVGVCRQGRVFLISTADAHSLDDPEMLEWPPHCIKGTPGSYIVPEGRARSRLVISNQPGAAIPDDLSAYQQVTLEKNTLDAFDNPNAEALMARFTPEGRPSFDRNPEFIVFGVVTEYCVRIEAEELLRRGHRVSVVTDAIQPFDPQKGQQVLAELQARGARLITTDQALEKVSPPLARSA